MSSSGKNFKSPRAVILLALLLSLTFLPCKTDGNGEDLKQSESVLGSKPPQCRNKCSNCRPCKAILVISKDAEVKSGGDDENYYLVSWKCKCGNKLFHP